MFTGLVEGRGLVHDVRADRAATLAERPVQTAGEPAKPHAPSSPPIRLTIEASPEMGSEVRLGESVAINGCCLTVVAVDGRLWSFQAGSETLSKTNLGRLGAGDAVNLERALAVGERLGGHFVQGHVDGVGRVERIERDGEWIKMGFRVERGLSAQMVPKGSVAVDGVSLTLVDVRPDSFSVALIPHTLAATTLGLRKPGDEVNIETDLIGKYVRSLMQP
jgi:riboflavin synthase